MNLNHLMSFDRTPEERSQAKIQMFCFHHAGGAAQMFRSWAKGLSPVFEVTGIQLPGRWNRHNEPAYTRMDPLIRSVSPAIEAHVRMPFVFYGHSLGGLIAFEVCRYLREHSELSPRHLFVSSRIAPQLKLRFPSMFKLTEIEFEDELARRYGMLPPEIAADEDAKKLFLDITRKDMELYETYQFVPQDPLEIPISILTGRGDSIVLREDLEPWKEHTSLSFQLAEFEGDHFFIRSQEKKVLDFLTQSLLV